MPTAPKKPCARPGCAALVDAGFCPSCSSKGFGKDSRPSAAVRGYGHRWQKASKAYLRQHPLAVDIFKNHGGRLYRAECVDHITPVTGPDDPNFWRVSNWQGLTLADHSAKTVLEDGGLGHARKPKP